MQIRRSRSRSLLSLGCPGVWWWSRRASAPATGNRRDRLGLVERLSCRLRCRAGSPRSLVHVRSISRLDDGASAEPLDRCVARHCRPSSCQACCSCLRRYPTGKHCALARRWLHMLAGVNASVVGLLATALYSPVWTGAVLSELDFAVAATGFFLLARWKIPPLAVVVLCALAGIVQSTLH